MASSSKSVNISMLLAHGGMFWGDLMGEPSDTQEVGKSWKLDLGYFKQTGVFGKVPVEEAKDGGRKVLCVCLGRSAEGGRHSQIQACRQAHQDV